MAEGSIPRWAMVILLGLLAYLGKGFGDDIIKRLDSLGNAVVQIQVGLATLSTQVNEDRRRIETIERHGTAAQDH